LTYEQNLGSLNREKDDLLRRKNEYESKIALLGQELERLNSILRARNEENGKLASELENLKKAAQQRIQMTETEFTTLQSNYATVSKEYETAKRHLQEYEQSIRKLYTEFERLQGIINELKKENQTLHAMVPPSLLRTTT
jgi:chromosome segregation ATPase